MKKNVIIIGGGIVGSTAAFYLSQDETVNLTLIDHGVGTATRAAAGIICPWMAQKKNKDWYKLTSEGAVFYRKLVADLESAGAKDIPFKQTGTIGLKSKPELLEKIQKIAEDRRVDTPTIGQITSLQGEEISDYLPPLKPDFYGIHLEGGGRIDGGRLIDILQEEVLKNGGALLQGQAKLLDAHTVELDGQELTADHIILATGAWLPHILEPLGYRVDVRPQKGQLLELDTKHDTNNWPVCMPYGQIDILPFEKGKIIVGATHEDDMGYDLTLDPEKIQAMQVKAAEFMPDLANYSVARTRIGTRAYTSNYAPFYGNIEDMKNVWVASGLGSSGLTNGPFIGWQIAQEILGKETSFDRSAYSPTNYIKKAL
ncbi:NAD(P)/FAD-dependent oxidoreductase [Streptococcus suis]|uniref:NAD(P)/FAD-dependent oxidoreductase n=1 Tax=Streptococcus suis TaxID=1307 RepID=UPI0005CDF20C|nr:FAD-binding oxidoreductase [Streptococcus suis]CYV32414.1 glycine/D-amino acid oxidases (deaminating) [Streptococcus suis]